MNCALSEQSSVQWPNEVTVDETNIPVHNADTSACSYSDESLVMSEKVQNSESLSSRLPHTKTVRSRPALAFFLQQNISKPSYTEPALSTDHKIQLYGGRTDDETTEAIYQNLPPPLPPKKYALTGLHGLEHDSTVSFKSTEVLCTNPSNTERHVASITSKAVPEASPFADEERLTATFHGKEPSKTDFSSVNDLWGVSSIPANKGPCLTGTSTNSTDANANDIVSLTTYFSVDNCMTDTYRMKYHQRPKLYFADAGVLNKETPVPPTGMQLNMSYHSTSDSSNPTAEQRHKPNIGNVHCSR